MFGQTPAQRLARRYRREGDAYLVEVHLRELRALFNSLDPAPFLDKDLDDEAEQYIVGAVEEFPLGTPLKLVFHVPATTPTTPARPCWRTASVAISITGRHTPGGGSICCCARGGCRC